VSQYAYVYDLSPQSVNVESAITFDSNGPMSSGISHPPGAAGITVADAGIYDVQFSVSAVQANQFAVAVNGVVVPSTIYGSGAGLQQNVGQAIIAVPALGVLTIVNHTSAAAVTLQVAAGGTQADTNASVVIEQVG
jgi:hypothetical protein